MADDLDIEELREIEARLIILTNNIRIYAIAISLLLAVTEAVIVLSQPWGFFSYIGVAAIIISLLSVSYLYVRKLEVSEY